MNDSLSAPTPNLPPANKCNHTESRFPHKCLLRCYNFSIKYILITPPPSLPPSHPASECAESKALDIGFSQSEICSGGRRTAPIASCSRHMVHFLPLVNDNHTFFISREALINSMPAKQLINYRQEKPFFFFLSKESESFFRQLVCTVTWKWIIFFIFFWNMVQNNQLGIADSKKKPEHIKCKSESLKISSSLLIKKSQIWLVSRCLIINFL